MKIAAILFLFVLLLSKAYASYPTVEGLFRNGSNQEVSGTYIVVKFNIEPSEDDLFGEKQAESEQEGVEDKSKLPDMMKELMDDKKEKLKPKYLTWIFSFKNEHRVELLQLMYSGSSMRGQDLEYLSHIRDFAGKIKKEANLDRAFFYSLMSTLVYNDSTGFLSFLKEQGVDFPDNSSLMNQDKVTLLEKYKKYLQAKKEDEAAAETLPSPLDAENPQKKQQINEVLNANMYKKSDYVKLSRIEGSFFWEIDIPKFKALFTNNKRELYKVEYSTDTNNVKAMAGNYILFNGVHHLPKKVLFKNTNGQNFKIRMLYLKHYSNPKSIDMAKKKKEYSELIGKQKRKTTERPSEEFYDSLFFIK